MAPGQITACVLDIVVRLQYAVLWSSQGIIVSRCGARRPHSGVIILLSASDIILVASTGVSARRAGLPLIGSSLVHAVTKSGN